jgi:hypothetical protein
MYPRLTKQLCKQPFLPNDTIPLFNTLQTTMPDTNGHSKQQQQFLKELGWMLDLLHHGYGESSVKVYERMHVFEIGVSLLHLTSSPTTFFTTSYTASEFRSSLIQLLFRMSDQNSLRRHSLAAVCVQDVTFDMIADCRKAMLARASLQQRSNQHELEFSLL